MLESHLVEGRQNLTSGHPLVYGQSITDGCLAWEDTAELLEGLAHAVQTRRAQVKQCATQEQPVPPPPSPGT